MRFVPIEATCKLCHSNDIELVINDDHGPVLLCADCGFVRVAQAIDMLQDFTICA